MFGNRQQETVVVVLRDAHEIGDALERALATADAAERPGLARAAAIVAAERGRDDAEVRGRWVRGMLGTSGVDPRTDLIAAVKALRRAVPGLRLAAAVEMAKEAAGKG
ncbi:hypothetical protein [Streptomyces sp. 8N706]|uniref:hypothetical protein n=1 Tax=Streptomyces sp. 8N706 TaxID=3457416 RepID=UPI003FD57923